MQVDALAFGAHPDDVELGCGGTLALLSAKGYRVGIISLTRGELSTRGDPETRKREFDEAAKLLGASHHEAMRIPDGDIQNTMENRRLVIERIRSLRPRILLVPYWRDRHPDHVHASRLVAEASYYAGLKRLAPAQAPHRPHRALYYPTRHEFSPSFIIDISGFFEIKMSAVRAYRSQFGRGDEASQGDRTNISHPGFLQAIEARARQYGAYVGAEFGEPFLVREPLRMEDPISFFDERYRNAFL